MSIENTENGTGRADVAALRLADAASAFLAKIDEEAEHGEYGAAYPVPDKYADEDYYAVHHRIVSEAAELRAKVEGIIAEIREGRCAES